MSGGDHPPGRPRDPAAGAWADMRARWAAGRPSRVEDYLADGAVPADDPDRVVDLVYAEFVLREEAGLVPTAAEYAARFPHLADRIARQLELHAALSSRETGSAAHTVTQHAPPGGPAAAPGGLPERVGKYRVVARLGAGGQGTVYRAVHPELGQDVVVKVTHDPVPAASADGTGLAAEGRILAALSHPHLVRVYDLGVDDGGRPFLAMEYVPGRTLEQAARQARPAAREAARVVAGLARAVAHAHARGVVHLDLKPANVLVGDDGVARVLDFGLGRRRGPWEERPDDTTDVSGTLPYMPPERAAGSAGQSLERADVYGLGGVLYFLLVGHPPVRGRTASEVWDKARAGGWDRSALARPDVPRGLRAICERCLAADPAARYGSADEVAAALERVARGPVVPRWAAVAAVVLAGVGLAAWLMPSREPIPPTTPEVVRAAPAEASVRLRVWHEDQKRYRELIHCLPLQAGDEVRVEGERPAGWHAVLLWADTDGAVLELAAARPDDAGTALAYPAVGMAVPVRGRAGTEVLLLCGRRDRPVDVAAVRAALAGVKGWPGLPGMSVLRLARDKVVVENSGRGPGAATDRFDPEGEVQKRLDALRVGLAAECEVLAGLAVAHE